MKDLLRTIGQELAMHGTSLAERPPSADKKEILELLGRDELIDALEDAAMALGEAITEEPLRVRDLAEWELLGAAFVLGCSPEDLPNPGQSFDRAVRPESWRLVTLNEVRQAALDKIAPAMRERFWWWHEGAGIDPKAVEAMSAAAQLVAKFPAARSRFDALVRAESAWTQPQEQQHEHLAKVRSLRTWLTAGLSLAAAASERTLLEMPQAELSFVAPSTLIVDLLADRRSGALPTLAGMVASIVPDAEERFTFELTASMLDATKGVILVLPLITGDHTIELPP